MYVLLGCKALTHGCCWPFAKILSVRCNICLWAKLCDHAAVELQVVSKAAQPVQGAAYNMEFKGSVVTKLGPQADIASYRQNFLQRPSSSGVSMTLHPSKTYIMPKHEFGHSYLAAKPDLAEDT